MSLGKLRNGSSNLNQKQVEETMNDLFTLDRQFEPINMPDADVSMLHEVEMPLPYNMMLRKLIDQTIWRQESVKIYGKDYQNYGELRWNYGDSAPNYCSAGPTPPNLHNRILFALPGRLFLRLIFCLTAAQSPRAGALRKRDAFSFYPISRVSFVSFGVPWAWALGLGLTVPRAQTPHYARRANPLGAIPAMGTRYAR
jgi:hypothetical protein